MKTDVNIQLCVHFGLKRQAVYLPFKRTYLSYEKYQTQCNEVITCKQIKVQ